MLDLAIGTASKPDRSRLEARSPSTVLFKQNQEGDRADRVAGSGAFAIEAIGFGAETVAAVFQSWQPEFATAVVGWMRVYVGWAVDRVRQLCPALQLNALSMQCLPTSLTAACTGLATGMEKEFVKNYL